MTCVEAFGGRGGRRQAAVGVLRACSGRAGVAVLERALAGLRDSRHAVDPRRQARRHRLDDGRPTPRRTSPTRSPRPGRRAHGEPLPRLRVAAARARPRRGHRARRVRARPDLQPRGPDGAARGCRTGRSVAASVVAGAAARQRGGRRHAGELGSVGLVVGATVGMPSPTSVSTSPAAAARSSPRASAPRAAGPRRPAAVFGAALGQRPAERAPRGARRPGRRCRARCGPPRGAPPRRSAAAV